MQKLRIRFSIRTILFGCLIASLPLALFFSELDHQIEQGLIPSLNHGDAISIFDASGFVMTSVGELPVIVQNATVVSIETLSQTKCRITARVRVIDKVFLFFSGPDLCIDRADGESDRLWVAVEP